MTIQRELVALVTAGWLAAACFLAGCQLAKVNGADRDEQNEQDEVIEDAVAHRFAKSVPRDGHDPGQGPCSSRLHIYFFGVGRRAVAAADPL